MADFTLVLCLGDFVARADWARGKAPRLVARTRVEPARDATLAQRVTAALRALEPPAEVIVVSDEAFAATVELDALAARGLSGSELGNALSCEVQLSSGLGAEEAAIEWRPLAESRGARTFRIVEVARRDLEAVDRAVLAMDARFAGITHPDELPSPAPADREGALEGEEWTAWLESAGGALARRDPLLVRAPARPMPNSWKVAIAIAGALAMLVLARSDHRRIARETASTRVAAAAARAPMEELQATHADLRRLDGELRDLRARLPRPVEAAGPRWKSAIPVDFLRGIAAKRPSGVRIDGISIAASGGGVEGLAARIEAVDELLLALERTMAAHGVSLTLASRRLVDDGLAAGLYRFRLAVRPIAASAGAAGDDR